MKATLDFSPVAPDEQVAISFDFATYLAAGDSISTVSAWNASVSGQSLVPDPTPSARKIGAPVLTGSIVSQEVGGCVENVNYVMECVVITAAGEALSLWSYLPCLPVGQG